MRQRKTVKKTYVVVLRLSELSVPEMIGDARYYCSSLEDNPHLQQPSPTAAEILDCARRLEEAWIGSQAGLRLATRRMYNLRRDLHYLLTALGHYVQGVANNLPEPAILITAAGMQYKNTKGRRPNRFRVERGTLRGTVKATAPAQTTRSIYEWEYRLKDQPQWQRLSTVKASCRFTGLEGGGLYQFRQRTITRHGAGNWSQTAELIVI